MRDRIPQALPRAPPSFGACGGARAHTRTSPQHRSRPGYAGTWQRPGRQAARARYARSHPASSNARATVLWRVWWRAHRHSHPPATPLRANRAGLHRKPSETPKPSTRREDTGRHAFASIQTFTDLYRRDSAAIPREPPARATVCKTKRKALHSRPKTAPETGAITARKSLHSAKTPIALLCRRSNDHADILFLALF